MFQGDARESKGPRPRPSVPSSLPLSCYVQQHICKVLAEMLDAFATYLWSACRNFRKGRSTTRRAARGAPYSLRGRPLCLRQTQGKPRDPVPVRPSLPPFPFPVMSSQSCSGDIVRIQEGFVRSGQVNIHEVGGTSITTSGRVSVTGGRVRRLEGSVSGDTVRIQEGFVRSGIVNIDELAGTSNTVSSKSLFCHYLRSAVEARILERSALAAAGCECCRGPLDHPIFHGKVVNDPIFLVWRSSKTDPSRTPGYSNFNDETPSPCSML